jgi:hypothetical protein
MKSNGLHAGNIVKEAKEMWAAAAVTTLRHSRRQDSTGIDKEIAVAKGRFDVHRIHQFSNFV